MERGAVAYRRLDEILQTEPDIADLGTRTVPADAQLTWAIQHFAYPGYETQVLRDFHGALFPGQTLGIVGATGTGKSTFIKLLLRHYEHLCVEICFNAIPLTEYRLASLREHCVVVPQESFLFSTTIAANIGLGCPTATRDQIMRAAQLANVHDDILAFPNGYDTLVGEKGITLSGGQKQRLAIARALLLDAPLLILDDALSAVDVATEQQILGHLRQARHHRTTLIVCHRLTAVEQADQVIVLGQRAIPEQNSITEQNSIPEKGTILEQGTHNQLLAAGGWYAQMYRYQQIEQAVEEGR
jgi:ABC-type multidrug transport system fused ATPase/permease subunit